MISILSLTLLIILGLGWMAGVVALFVWVISGFDDAGASLTRRSGYARAVIGGLRLIVFGVYLGVSLGVVLALEGDDPHASVLCRAGHEEWVTVHGGMMVGKTWMPTTSTTKQWVCDAWAR